MREVEITLKSIDEVKQFVQTLTMFEGEFEVISGKYIVDAKSILGLFSVDLSKPVVLRIGAADAEDVLHAISRYRTNGSLVNGQ